MAAFTTERVLRFGDCDPSGIAYFPAYLDILNGVVEEFWARLGFPWTELIHNRRIGLPTVHLEADFAKPSRMGDTLTFALTLAKVGGSSLHLAHTVTAGGEPRWSATQVVAATDLDKHRAQQWPADIRAALDRFKEAS